MPFAQGCIVAATGCRRTKLPCAATSTSIGSGSKRKPSIGRPKFWTLLLPREGWLQSSHPASATQCPSQVPMRLSLASGLLCWRLLGGLEKLADLLGARCLLLQLGCCCCCSALLSLFTSCLLWVHHLKVMGGAGKARHSSKHAQAPYARPRVLVACLSTQHCGPCHRVDGRPQHRVEGRGVFTRAACRKSLRDF